jgi:hypothetical protein
MTLHEAIAKLLKEKGQSLTTRQIADALNSNKWYTKGDGSAIATSQIGARIRKYPQIFSKEGSLVVLKGSSNTRKAVKPTKAKTQASSTANSEQSVFVERKLMNKALFKNPANIESLVPDSSGLYCIRIKNTAALPETFKEELQERKHDIMYIGIASQSLKKRMLGQELRAKGHGTFFRSLGAMLGYLPPKGSLKDKKKKHNYKFSPSDEKAIISWINKNLMVNWITYSGNFEDIESALIIKYLPLMNLAKNPKALQALSNLRADCVRVAGA